MGVAVLRIVPLDAREQARHPGVLRLEEAHAQPGMELEHAAHDHGDQGLLHLDPVAGHVAVEAVLPVQHVHVRVPRPRALVEAPRDVQALVQAVERIPVVGVPVVAVDQVGTQEGPDRAHLSHAAEQLPAGEMDVVRRQHGHELELVGAVLAELVDPVVVGLAQGEGEMRVHVVAGEEAQPRGRIEDGDIHALDPHAHDLRHRVVLALDGEIEAPRVGEPGSRERLGAVGAAGRPPLAILLQLGVHGGVQAVDDDGAALRAPVGADGQAHPAPELGLQILLEKIRRFHDVHVAVDEPEPIFHDASLEWLCAALTPMTATCPMPAILLAGRVVRHGLLGAAADRRATRQSMLAFARDEPSR